MPSIKISTVANNLPPVIKVSGKSHKLIRGK